MKNIIDKFNESAEHTVTKFYSIVKSGEYSINEIGELVEYIVLDKNTTFQDKLFIKSDYNNIHPFLKKLSNREVEQYVLDKSLVLHTPVIEGYINQMILDLIETDLTTSALTRYFESHSEEVSKYLLIVATNSNYFNKLSIKSAYELFFIFYGSHVTDLELL